MITGLDDVTILKLINASVSCCNKIIYEGGWLYLFKDFGFNQLHYMRRADF